MKSNLPKYHILWPHLVLKIVDADIHVFFSGLLINIY